MEKWDGHPWECPLCGAEIADCEGGDYAFYECGTTWNMGRIDRSPNCEEKEATDA